VGSSEQLWVQTCVHTGGTLGRGMVVGNLGLLLPATVVSAPCRLQTSQLCLGDSLDSLIWRKGVLVFVFKVLITEQCLAHRSANECARVREALRVAHGHQPLWPGSSSSHTLCLASTLATPQASWKWRVQSEHVTMASSLSPPCSQMHIDDRLPCQLQRPNTEPSHSVVPGTLRALPHRGASTSSLFCLTTTAFVS
jgi:hypothetical protein